MFIIKLPLEEQSRPYTEACNGTCQKCTVLYRKVHRHDKLTKHLFFQDCKSVPFLLTSERSGMYWRAGVEQGDRIAGAKWVGRGGKVGSDDRESLRGKKGTVTSRRATRQRDNPHGGEMHVTQEAQEDGADGERPGTSGGSFRTLWWASGNEGSGRDLVGNSPRARLTAKLGRHFHMYILEMYIDTLR